MLEELGGRGAKDTSLTLGPQWGTIRAVQPCHSAMDTLPASCRERLIATGQPYPKSDCEVCGPLSPRSKECKAEMAKRLKSLDASPGSYHHITWAELVSLLKEIAFISLRARLLYNRGEAIEEIYEITKPFVVDKIDKPRESDSGEEKHEQGTGFHLRPGDQCRLLDGPSMIYLGTEEHDDQAHCFAYWVATNGTDELVTIYLKPSVARFVEKVEQ